MKEMYKQTTREERYSIEQMRKAGCTQSAIVSCLGCSGSMISREVHRSLGRRGYRHKQTDEMANQHLWEGCKRRKFTPEIQVAVEGYLREDFSSEQVTGLMRPGENTRLVRNAFISTFIATTITVGLFTFTCVNPERSDDVDSSAKISPGNHSEPHEHRRTRQAEGISIYPAGWPKVKERSILPCVSY
jgi:hypothetical protein